MCVCMSFKLRSTVDAASSTVSELGLLRFNLIEWLT